MSRIALITGGTGGLGNAICRRLVRSGHKVVANYFPPMQAEAEKWCSELASEGINCAIIGGDVANVESSRVMAEAVLSQHGTVSVLVNNAGITRDATIRNLEADDWQSVINTNLSSLYNVTRPLLDSMLEQGFGRIVNISSVSGQRGQFGQTNYSAAKAGVHGFTKALALETARKGITVNTISPGFIATDMVQAMPDHVRASIVETIPVGRVGQPEDIARTVEFLVHEESSYITGTEISVNGGLFMH